jgi:tRNA pseudouridine13 synthase
MSPDPPRALFEPPLLTGDLPAVGGSVGPEPEDFVVDEIPSVVPSGQGEHLYVRVRKRLWTTPDMLHAVARAARVRERDLGSAGMKDKHAVTSQWLSLPPGARPPDEWELPEGLEVLESRPGERKLRTGQQLGNRFRIRLVGVEDASAATAIIARLRERGLPNYFGAQRFGRGGNNVAEAIAWLARGAPAEGRRARFYRKLYPSVVQAGIFNRYLALRSELGLDHLLEGEVVRLDGSRSVFVVEDPHAELPRLVSGDIHLTGPITGPRMKQPEGTPRELEAQATSALGVGSAELGLMGRLADGTRRDLLAKLEGLALESRDDGSLVLDFSLPSGSYATGVIRELTHAPFLEAR